jgi:hypothetical protein
MSSTIQMESPWHQNLGRGGDLSRLRLGLIDEKVNETKWAFPSNIANGFMFRILNTHSVEMYKVMMNAKRCHARHSTLAIYSARQ